MSASIIFISGISGVFIGMGMIYLSIKGIELFVNRYPEKEKGTSK